MVPRLTIGLPVYNGEAYLAESLDALLGQSYEDFELLISDNASTDGTAGICQRYLRQDPRVRYVRQPRNIGAAPNHNYVFQHGRGELFQTAAHDDLYARDLIKRCVDVLDEDPRIVLAYSWSAAIDTAGSVNPVECPVATDAPQAPERFRSMLFDGWIDALFGVVRREVLLRIAPHGSYHFADRTFVTELALNGPFYQVPDYLYFRREYPEQAGGQPTVRGRCSVLDPSRTDTLRHPVARLYAEYVWGYVAAVRRAPLTPQDRRQCYRYLAHYMTGRVLPVANRIVTRRPLRELKGGDGTNPQIPIHALVAGQQVGPS
jgi:glycosyltransferase involved in cell wall biosynthesis